MEHGALADRTRAWLTFHGETDVSGACDPGPFDSRPVARDVRHTLLYAVQPALLETVRHARVLPFASTAGRASARYRHDREIHRIAPSSPIDHLLRHLKSLFGSSKIPNVKRITREITRPLLLTRP
jgi:hypothetical protein